MTTLKEAREKGKLDKFIKEHRKDPKGDPEKFNRTLKAMAGKSSGDRPASSQDAPDD